MKRAIVMFLRDRIGFTVAFFLNVVVILFLFYLIQPQWVIEQIPYVFLLSFTIYLCIFAFSFFHWYPAMKLIEKKLTQRQMLDAFSAPIYGGTYEQQFYSQVFLHLYRSFAREYQKLVKIQKEHREFIELWIHQMKLPVSSLSLMVQQTVPQTIEEKKRLYNIDEEIEKLNEGLNMALSMARLSDFSFDYHIRPVSLMEQVQDVIESRKKAMIRLSIFPKMVAEKEDWTVLTDPKWHRFVLEQIVQNALKYAGQFREKSRLLFTFVKKDQQIQLLIQDEGPGIPVEDLPRVFDPFFTGTNGRKFSEATGMGLYLVKKICDQLEHQIHISSTVGKGTTVKITYNLP